MGRPVVWAELTCAQCGKVILVKPCELHAGRRFCSVECRSAALPPPKRFGNKDAWRGDRVTRWAFHKRAGKIKPAGPCERCGGDGELVHHRDHDPRNNVISNLERLCRPCHLKHHRKSA